MNSGSSTLRAVSRRWQVTSPTGAAEAHILRLPPEVLIQIFQILHKCNENATEIYLTSEENERKATFRDLARVHPLLYDASCMFLYHTINVATFPGQKPSAALRRSLQERPGLGAHIRRLSVHYGEYCHVPEEYRDGPESLKALEDIVQVSTTARILYIWATQSPKEPVALSTILQSTLPKLPLVQCFHLRGDFHWQSIYTPELYRWLAQAPCLHTISLHGQFGNGRHAAAEPVPSELERTSPITYMSLSNCEDGFNVAVQLFRLPKRLERLEISAEFACGYNTEICEIFKALEMHGDSLKAVDLGYLDCSIGRLYMDLSPFTVLKTLKLSWWSIGIKWTPVVFEKPLGRGLLGPALEELTLQFNSRGAGMEMDRNVEDLSKQGIAWIHEFGRFAARRKSKLKRIRIEFYVNESGLVESYYPWELLDSVKRDLEGRGIDLDFENPYSDKQQYLNYAKQVRETWERLANEEAARAQDGNHEAGLVGEPALPSN